MKNKIYILSIALIVNIFLINVSAASQYNTILKNIDKTSLEKIIIESFGNNPGLQLARNSDNTIVFVKKPKNAMLAQVLLGGLENGTVPEWRLTFVLAETGNGVAVNSEITGVIYPGTIHEIYVPYDGAENRDFLEALEKKYNGYTGFGFHCDINYVDGGYKVISVAKGGPFEKESIEIGDKIIAVDGRSVSKNYKKYQVFSKYLQSHDPIEFTIEKNDGARTVKSIYKGFIPPIEEKMQPHTTNSTNVLLATNPAQPLCPELPTENGWKAVLTWRGVAGKKNTENFSIENGEWRVRWSTVATSGSEGPLVISLFQGQGQLLETVGNIRGENIDCSYMKRNGKNLYLQIESGQPYIVAVEVKGATGADLVTY